METRRMWQTNESDAVTVLRFAGYHALGDSCEECDARWADELAAICSQLTTNAVILDLTEASFVTNRLLASVVRAYRDTVARGATCRVVGSAAVYAVCTATKLDQLIELYESRTAALASVST